MAARQQAPGAFAGLPVGDGFPVVGDHGDAAVEPTIVHEITVVREITVVHEITVVREITVVEETLLKRTAPRPGVWCG